MLTFILSCYKSITVYCSQLPPKFPPFSLPHILRPTPLAASNIAKIHILVPGASSHNGGP